ncbi:lectin-domain containing receptor kinase VI.3-like [Panicum miliaceum]|uniref:alpha-amylase n=1 Tax=Panicum miliaceum TaxID=4540 RepID=A0A3L6TEV3_PANMI|nr:lectin-domain containing receptor kinase VI.3-like [Panicum miliaceum]
MQDAHGNAPGLIGMRPDRTVTFFYDHFFDPIMKDEITKMVKIRTQNKIGPASKLRVLAQSDAYVAQIDGRVLAKVGARYDVSKAVPDGFQRRCANEHATIVVRSHNKVAEKRRRRQPPVMNSRTAVVDHSDDSVDDEEFGEEADFEKGVGPRRYYYRKLAAATGNFAAENKLGSGGFGTVYRGCKGLLLVYELVLEGSLDQHLFGSAGGHRLLAWPERYRVAVGLGAVLAYLHEEWEQYVVHGDIKPNNVMLDASHGAKLGDFGLARRLDHGAGPRTTRVVMGTMGYMDPDLVSTHWPGRASNVYSFGVVLLEVACGRPAADELPGGRHWHWRSGSLNVLQSWDAGLPTLSANPHRGAAATAGFSNYVLCLDSVGSVEEAY